MRVKNTSPAELTHCHSMTIRRSYGVNLPPRRYKRDLSELRTLKDLVIDLDNGQVQHYIKEGILKSRNYSLRTI